MSYKFDLLKIKQALGLAHEARDGGVQPSGKHREELRAGLDWGNRESLRTGSESGKPGSVNTLGCDAIPSGHLVFAVTADGKIDGVNLSALLTQEDGEPEEDRHLFLDSECNQAIVRWGRFFAESLQAGGRQHYEVPLRRRDGAISHVGFDCLRLDKNGGRAEVRVVFSDVTALKGMGSALVQSENRFRLIVEAIDEVFWMADAALEQMRYISPAYESLWGRTVQSLYENPRSFIEAIHPDDLASVISDLDSSRSGQPFSYEYRIVRADGTIRWVSDRGFPLYSKTGKLTGYAGVARDITEHKRYEQTLELHKKILNFAQDGFWIVDAEGYLLEANLAYADISGYAQDELIGMHISQFDIREESAEVKAHISTVMTRGYDRFDTIHRHKEGHEIDIEVSVMFILETGRMAAFLRDITGQKRTERELYRQKNLLHQIIDTDPDMVCVKDAEGMLLLVNRAAAAVYGASPMELVGRKSPDAHSAEYLASNASANRQVIETGRKIELEVCDFRNGMERWLHVTRLPMAQPDGAVHVLSMETDITEKKIAEKQLQALTGHLQSVREEEKASIAREIHDDLGGTLTALKMEINLLAGEEAVSGNAAARERVEAISQLLDGAMSSTRRIISELRPAILDDFGLRPALDWQAGLFSKRTGIGCNIFCAPCGGCDISVNKEWNIHLFRIFQEALTNVARHSGASRVEVAMRCNNGVCMSIRDDGCGLPQNRAVRPDTFGIRGMAERVAYLGGKIGFDSPPGGGLEVTVELFPGHKEEAIA